MVRSKFKVQLKGPGDRGAVRLTPVYSSDPNNENKSFWDATPSGSIELYITNPVAFAQFELDEEYYVDFTKVPKAEPTHE